MLAMSTVVITLLVTMETTAQLSYNATAVKALASYWQEQNISTTAIPVPSIGTPVKVEVGFFMKTVVDVNPADQTAAVVGTFVFKWTDSQLAWNTQEFATDRADIASKNIWTPTFQLISGVRQGLNVRLDPRFDSVQVNQKGQVIAQISDTFSTRCSVNTVAFPYDNQECDLNFKSDFPTSLVLLLKMNVTDEEMTSDFINNSEWSMSSFSLTTQVPNESQVIENLGLKSSEAHIKFVVKRNPYYYLVLLVVPILMSTILIIIIPLIPMHSGERLGFTTNLFLAFVLFLLLVDNMLPKSSFSSLTISMTISVILVLLNIFETIIVGFVDDYLNNAAAAATTEVFPMTPSPPESPVPVDLQEDSGARPRSQSRMESMKKMNRWMKRMKSLIPPPKNPRLLMHRVDRAFAVLNALVVICANLYISSKIIPT